MGRSLLRYWKHQQKEKRRGSQTLDLLPTTPLLRSLGSLDKQIKEIYQLKNQAHCVSGGYILSLHLRQKSVNMYYMFRMNYIWTYRLFWTIPTCYFISLKSLFCVNFISLINCLTPLLWFRKINHLLDGQVMISGRKNGELSVQVHTYREEHQYYTPPKKKKNPWHFQCCALQLGQKICPKQFYKASCFKIIISFI